MFANFKNSQESGIQKIYIICIFQDGQQAYDESVSR
jgi:hypothetical protein